MKKEKIEALKTLFGFDFIGYDSIYRNSLMVCLFKTLEEARKVKKAYEVLKEEFGWEKEVSIYKYYERAYSVECPDDLEGDYEKIE